MIPFDPLDYRNSFQKTEKPNTYIVKRRGDWAIFDYILVSVLILVVIGYGIAIFTLVRLICGGT